MKVAANLTQNDIREAVSEYLMRKGFTSEPSKITFHFTRGDRPYDSDELTATAECEMKPKTTFRGIQDGSSS